MKTRYQVFCISVLLTAMSLASSVVDAAARYTVTDLGTLGGSDWCYGQSAAYAINNNGQMAGQSGGYPVVYENGQVTGLTESGIYGSMFGINDSGWACGGRSDDSDPSWKAILWKNSEMIDLGTLGTGTSLARGINNAGQVVGWTGSNETEPWRAFIWENGEMTDLGTLPGDNLHSQAYDVNNLGEVVGLALSAADGYDHPFLYKDGKMVDLGMIGRAFAINDKSQILIGDTFVWENGVACNIPFIWDNGELTRLDPNLHPKDINNDSQVVGYFGVSGGTHAGLWENGAFYDLNSLMEAPSAWVIEYAAAINDLGQITGSGQINGETHAFLLTPVPEPSSIAGMILGLSSFGGLILRKKVTADR